ncbi:hypothetical protein PF005_g15096 [Phytophthora fragariae]|uniref:DUF659 domain-containing protein n=1 Tax=Phytophthora fragariae TaxID=53985 RepID=A0A6A4D4R9_9STRA|nr:hypothetical protein PF011_g14031 [Phytophthora fragariae]KAE9099758.1 hypothetical protein PF007_g15761 [Phytophthora fragariae]KAE9136127.1 hypothetical protein PF006_g14451 [Phytophthora fragariae]KAE9201063.1 hypothetical protein PF005_g15096 [Phytophthora fragariae]KAE9217326.1 hypothetical protein PF002_g16829 [Phytophthora fragariae]
MFRTFFLKLVHAVTGKSCMLTTDGWTGPTSTEIVSSTTSLGTVLYGASVPWFDVAQRRVFGF